MAKSCTKCFREIIIAKFRVYKCKYEIGDV